jgi:hypothetical protein
VVVNLRSPSASRRSSIVCRPCRRPDQGQRPAAASRLRTVQVSTRTCDPANRPSASSGSFSLSHQARPPIRTEPGPLPRAPCVAPARAGATCSRLPSQRNAHPQLPGHESSGSGRPCGGMAVITSASSPPITSDPGGGRCRPLPLARLLFSAPGLWLPGTAARRVMPMPGALVLRREEHGSVDGVAQSWRRPSNTCVTRVFLRPCDNSGEKVRISGFALLRLNREGQHSAECQLL